MLNAGTSTRKKSVRLEWVLARIRGGRLWDNLHQVSSGFYS
ncbi:unnamed protein product [Phytomonas sp. EM1]|nr:unnamed protein product [Phytomonas sp. EM1]|eukprot:CCW61370.1 unnamed protein product [Phytomonas sp. isolate EM1]